MLHLRLFRRSDYSAYRRWFEDPWLNQALGPLDETWLQYVLSETDGAQYAAFQDEELVAVTGVAWGDFHHPYQVVTDLAVAPHRRRCGLGRQTLRALFRQTGPSAYAPWIAYVSSDNPGAQAFLRRLGWSHRADLTADSQMVAFEIRKINNRCTLQKNAC